MRKQYGKKRGETIFYASKNKGTIKGVEKRITSQFDNDPLLKLKSREVDLRAMENERKKDNDEAQINLARARLMQQGDIAEEKMDQNEKLAKLRAGVSLAKAGAQQATIVTGEE